MRKYLLILISLLLLSCSDYKFKITNDVEAKVVGHATTTIGIQFDLYDYTILLDLVNMKIAEMAYFSRMDKIPITVVIKADDSQLVENKIYLYHKDEPFGLSEGYVSPISLDDLMSRDLEIPNFVWYIYDGNDYGEGISPQELRAKLSEDGEDPPEVTIKEKTDEGDKNL
jgi:hypothetical protein